jgi:hypothetical protein
VIGITSFSPKGYEIYGRKFLESAVENWPCQLLVYYEEKPDFKHSKVSYKPLNEVYGLSAFLEYCDRNPVFSGRITGGYNFNYDAAKFCRKVFAQFDILRDYTGRVFWLDADMVFKKPMSEEFLTDDIFQDKTLALLMREGLHAESGFVGFDTRRGDFDVFLKTYIDIYRKGQLFGMRYWIDGHAIQEAVKLSGVSVNNLSADFPKNGINVMPHSLLGDYLHHNKGNRKFQAA